MSADDKLAVLKSMISILGEALLEGDAKQRFIALAVQFDEMTVSPKPKSKKAKPAIEGPIPDVHAEFATRDRSNFVQWASTLEIAMLKHIVKSEQLDPAGQAKSWRSAGKFAELIYDRLDGRSHRGAAFGKVASGAG